MLCRFKMTKSKKDRFVLNIREFDSTDLNSRECSDLSYLKSKSALFRIYLNHLRNY